MRLLLIFMKELDYTLCKEKTVYGRYVTLESLRSHWLKSIPAHMVSVLGNSVQGREIFSIAIGKGKKRILMWSQMHGNESTTTKAVVDMVNFFTMGSEHARTIVGDCTLVVVPILNPDGAHNYTRVNANGVDLNRDARSLAQPESRILRKLFEDFQPHFCFNLHDQRTLFSVGAAQIPATVSFLAPASDGERKITTTRQSAMQLVAAMNQKLQRLIPQQVGRYDDSFNADCVGDSFQMENVPTVLFEAGHYPNDYQREETRKLIFKALMEAIVAIASNTLESYDISGYFEIPGNEEWFFDVLIKNAHAINPQLAQGTQLGIQYKESLKEGRIHFLPCIAKMGNLDAHFGHQTHDCTDQEDLHALYRHNEILHLVQKATVKR